MTEVSNSTRPNVLGNRGAPGWTDPDALSRVVATSMRLTQRLAPPCPTPRSSIGPMPLGRCRRGRPRRHRCGMGRATRRRERLPTIDELIGLETWGGREPGARARPARRRGLVRWLAPTEMAATAAVLAAVPGLQQASFSVLAAGSEVVVHRGPNPGVIRALLGVAVPEPGAPAGSSVGSVTLQPRGRDPACCSTTRSNTSRGTTAPPRR